MKLCTPLLMCCCCFGLLLLSARSAKLWCRVRCCFGALVGTVKTLSVSCFPFRFYANNFPHSRFRRVFVCSNFSFSYSRVLTWNSRKSLGKCIKRTEITHRGGRGWAGGGEIEAETFLFSLIFLFLRLQFPFGPKSGKNSLHKNSSSASAIFFFWASISGCYRGQSRANDDLKYPEYEHEWENGRKTFSCFSSRFSCCCWCYVLSKVDLCWRRTELYISYPSRRKTGEIFSLGFFILSLLFSLYFFYSGFFHPFPIRQSLSSRPLGQPSITQQFHTPK